MNTDHNDNEPTVSTKYIPINKGNYSMDTEEREQKFELFRGNGWEDEYKKYRDDWVRLAKTQTVSDYPLLVDIELSSACNLKCPMCYTITEKFKEKVNVKLMDWDLYKKIIDEISGKVPAIRLSLRGESLLHKKFIDCIKYAKDNGIKEVSTLTNGAKLEPEYFKKMVEAGIDWITISVDGIWDTFEKIRKPIKFHDLLNKISHMHEYKQREGLVRPVIKVQGIWPAVHKNLEEYYKIFSPITDLVAFNPLIDYLANDTDIEYLENFSCPQQYQRLVIGADGLVMKCSNDEENDEVIGDIKDQSVHDVWHGQQLQKIRSLMKEENGFMKSSVCRKCYLPRKTEDEVCSVDGREFVVRNYVNRTQEIGR